MNTLSAAARRRMEAEFGEPWFLAGWKDVLMMHFSVRPEVLQPFVPFELDVRDGLAYVTLVGFTLLGMRPSRGGTISRLAMAPIATHEFLNVRTYVKCGHETGIYFLAEWLPNRLSVCLGRPVFGLPYKLGSLSYEHSGDEPLCGSVSARDSEVRWSGDIPDARALTTPEAGSLTEWLMERYTAFTEWLGMKRRFRVWHPPWPQTEAKVTLERTNLVAALGEWFQQATYAGAHWSPGFPEVWMGAPRWVRKTTCKTEQR